MDNRTSGDILHDLSLIDPVVKVYYHAMRMAKTPDEVQSAWTEMTKQLVKDKISLQDQAKNFLNWSRAHKYIIVTQEMYDTAVKDRSDKSST